MKTNQIITVVFGDRLVHIGHLDMMGDLNEFFAIGNSFRQQAGVPIMRVASWLESNAVKEYIAIVSEDIGRPAMVSKAGRGGYVKAHLRVLIDAAMYLDPRFKDMVIKTFVTNRLLQVRDDSGNGFIDLNASVALNAEAVFGKAAHQGHYIQLSKILRDRILPDGHPGWNHATPKQLNERTRIEEAVSNALRMGFVRDWEHLKEVAQKI